jgi:hypothetical protein
MGKVETRLEDLVNLQKTTHLSTTVPNPKRAPTEDAKQMVAGLDQTIKLVKVSLSTKTPGNPEEIAKTKKKLQTLVQAQKPLPQEVKAVAERALTYVQAYQVFTAHPDFFLTNIMVSDPNHRASSAICAPMLCLKALCIVKYSLAFLSVVSSGQFSGWHA